MRDSNPQPSSLHCRALPIELMARIKCSRESNTVIGLPPLWLLSKSFCISLCRRGQTDHFSPQRNKANNPLDYKFDNEHLNDSYNQALQFQYILLKRVDTLDKTQRTFEGSYICLSKPILVRHLDLCKFDAPSLQPPSSQYPIVHVRVKYLQVAKYMVLAPLHIFEQYCRFPVNVRQGIALIVRWVKRAR